MKIYVGNLPFDTGDGTLRTMFEKFGAVASAEVMADRVTGESRGFAFVEMPNASEAQAAIDGLNGTNLDDRALVVNEARPPKPRPPGGGGGGRGGWQGGRGGGGGGGGGYGGGGGGGGGGRGGSSRGKSW